MDARESVTYLGRELVEAADAEPEFGVLRGLIAQALELPLARDLQHLKGVCTLLRLHNSDGSQRVLPGAGHPPQSGPGRPRTGSAGRRRGFRVTPADNARLEHRDGGPGGSVIRLATQHHPGCQSGYSGNRSSATLC